MINQVVILGAGESGIGAAKLAKKLGIEVFLSDAGTITADRKAALEVLGVTFEEKGHTMSKILTADLVVKSPGIPDHVPVIQQILDQDIPVVSEIEFAFRYKPAHAKVIGITGTNGKTTTTLLIYHLLKTAGLNVAVGGNVGVSFAGLVAEADYDYFVIEVSSFQLDGIQDFRPDVAVLLNITPDHMDRYDHDFGAYVNSKFRIAENQTSDDAFVYWCESQVLQNELESRSLPVSAHGVALHDAGASAALIKKSLVFDFHLKGEKYYWELSVTDIPLIGKHNMLNAMSALMAAQLVGVSNEKLSEGIKSFVNASHRLEPCGEFNGVRFINDSKATNVDAVAYALDGVEAPIVWIAGGVDKGNDYSELFGVVNQKVKALICLGTKNEPLLNAFGDKLKDIVEVQSTDDAVAEALKLATEGDVVMLSPACASFDLFKNYEDRGDQFKASVKKLLDLNAVSCQE